MPSLTKKQLVQAVTEFNDVMALDPPIRKTNPNAKLEADIKEAAEELRGTDEFSPEVEEALVKLGIREPTEEEGEEQEQEGAEGDEAPVADTSDWLKGCEVCNVGLINEIDRQKEEEDASINKICKALVEAMEAEFGESPYSVGALKQRYLYHKGLAGKDDGKKKKAQKKDDDFSSAVSALKRVASLLSEVPKTKKFARSKEGKALIESIRQYALGVMICFHQLGIDPVKEIESWQKGQ
jgi:hypothetical protein